MDEILGMITGKVNGIEFFDGGMMTNLTLSASGRLFIDCSIERIPTELVNSLQVTNVLLAPKYWGVGNTKENKNGFQIANGNFKMNAQVTFVI